MKNLLMAFAMMMFLLSSCGSKQQQSSDGTHTHSDGSVHEAHDHGDHEQAVDQEVFEVKAEKADSAACCSEKKETCDHGCEGHSH